MRTALTALVFLVSITTAIQGQGISRKSAAAANRSQSKYLKTKELRIHYREWNATSDQTIILLHGLYDSSETWNKVAPLLAKRGFRVVAPDRRGSGRTSKPQTGYDIAALSTDVLEIINALQLRDVVIVGHSAGASVALTAASMKPDTFRAVVLVDGGFWPMADSSQEAIRPAGCNDDGPECERAIAIEKGNRDYNADSTYSKLTVPTLLLMAIPDNADAQPLTPDLIEAKRHVEKVAREKLSRGHSVFITGSGHWIQNDQPEKLATAIEEFVVDLGKDKNGP